LGIGTAEEEVSIWGGTYRSGPMVTSLFMGKEYHVKDITEFGTKMGGMDQVGQFKYKYAEIKEVLQLAAGEDIGGEAGKVQKDL